MIKLDDLKVYKLAMELGEEISLSVSGWEYFHKVTLGKQLIRAADSIALNISEGYGHYSFKENKIFCYYSRGSAFETFTALKKAYQRKLLSEQELSHFKSRFELFFKLLNGYIKSIGQSPALSQ